MKKRLLKEDVTRRMMKLANIDTLTESFIEETEELEEGGMAYARDDEEAMDEMAYDRDEDLEGAPEEEAMDVPAEGDVDVEELVSAIAAAIEEKTGVEVAVEGGAEEPAMDAHMDDMPAEEEPMDDAGEEPPAEEEGEEVMQEDEIEEDLAAADVTLEEEALEEEEIVNEVTRRVARRLLRASASRD